MTRTVNMISLPPPGRDGTLKTSVVADGATVLATPVKNGKLMPSPSHAHSKKRRNG